MKNTKKMKTGARFLGICSLLAGCALPARAGVPEPGIILYGVVLDSQSGSRVTSGPAQIIYSDTLTGQSVTNSFLLQDLAGGYCYFTEIQFESAVTNQPVTRADAFEMPPPGAATRLFNITATYGGSAAVPQTNLDTISFALKGKLQRLDLTATLVDSDHNGLPDVWEMQYFGHLGVDPNADPDHDGMSNKREFLAGTDPTNPNSVFKLTAINKAPAGLAIHWASVGGKTYTLLRSTNLAGAYVPIATGVLATPPENLFTDSNNVPRTGFYQVRMP
jgi:hypothetical protein